MGTLTPTNTLSSAYLDIGTYDPDGRAEDVFAASQQRRNLPITTTGGTTVLTTAQFNYTLFTVTGTLGSNAIIQIPDGVAQLFTVDNQTSGSFTLSIKHSATAAVDAPQGDVIILQTDGATATALRASVPITADRI